MRIIYLSHILNIHDFRFLDKLSSSSHDVLLVAIDNCKIPEPISSIYGLKYVAIPRPLPRHDYRYYFSFESIILALRHKLYRIIDKFGFPKKLFNKRLIFSHEEFRFLFYRKKLSRIIKKFKPDVLQCPFNVIDRRLNNKNIINLLKKNEIKIHARSIFLQGLLLIKLDDLRKKGIITDEEFNTRKKKILNGN